MRHRWVGRWMLEEVPCSFTFDSLRSRVIAGIDFTLKISAINEQVPEHFELEDLGPIGKEEIVWSYPILRPSRW
jgi:hypothetical protein